MFRFFRYLLLFLAFIPTSARAQSRIDCNALDSRMLSAAIHYCVLLPPGYEATIASHSGKRYPVLYFLHGLGENEQTLFSRGGWNLIEDLRQRHQIGDFLIVAPEGKGNFFINSADGKFRYSDFFIREFMPYIEGKYLIASGRKARAITGVSMGGYGALRFAFAFPQLFSSVSAQSAALIIDSPQELNTALRSGAPLGRLLGLVFGQPINVPHFRQNDAFVLARRNQAGIRKLAIYFNCGQHDDYGFEKGAEALHRQLQAEGIKHEFHLYPGNHGFAYFADHIAEVIEFHWHAFEGGK